MNWQEFEDRLKTESQTHQTPVDTDALWDSIREKKRRRLPVFWWLTGLGVLLIAGWLAMSYFSGNNSSHLKETVTFIQPDTIANIENLSANKTSHANSNYSSNTNAFKKSTSKFQNQSNQLSTKPEVFSANVSAINSNNINKFSLKNSTKKLFANKQLFRAKGNAIPFNVTETVKTGIATTTSKEIAAKDTTNYNQDSTVESGSNTLFFTNNSSISEVISTNLILPSLPILPANFLPLILPLPDNPLSPLLLPTAEIKLNKNQNRVYIGLQAGYFAWKIHQDTGATLRTGEKLIASTQIGLQVQLPIGQSWSLRTGVQYTQFSSVFRWTRKWEDTRDIPVPNYYVNGNIDSTFTTALYRYERNVQHYNRLQSISIPLDIQYRIALKHWNLRPSAGAHLQVWQKADGVILEGNEPNTQTYADIYKRAFNLGLRLGIALEIPVGERTRLTLEPIGILDITRRTQDIYPAERFQQWGINLGVLRRW